jgi:hypothetical protein
MLARHVESVTDPDILLEIPVYLQTSVYHFANQSDLFAETFSTPCVQLCVTNVTFSHKVVQLIAVIGEDIITADKV